MIGLYNRQLSEANRKSIFSLLEPTSNVIYLDLGCSTGELTLDIANRLGTKSISGIDIREKNTPNMIRVLSNLEDPFPFPNNYFDVITGSQVIEHLSNTDNFIEEIYRVLRPGGYIILSTANLSSLHIILMLLAGRQPMTCSISDKTTEQWMDEGPRHRRLFTMEGLVKVLEFHGFKIEKKTCSGYFPLPYSLSKIVCLVDRWHSNCITIKARKPNGKS